MKTGYYTPKELSQLGIKKIGTNVLVSKKASLYQTEGMEFGSNIRIDDFCYLMGNIKIGNFVHIAPYSNLVASDSFIEMQDYSGVSSRVSIYAVTDDYSGEAMTNPMIPNEYTKVYKAPVIMERYTIIGASSVVLPGVTVREGSSVGAMSLVNKSTSPWSVNIGVPCRKIRDRSKNLLTVEKKFVEMIKKDNSMSSQNTRILSGTAYEINDGIVVDKIVTEKDVENYAAVSGDFNPIHIDQDYAVKSKFHGRIVHGMLLVSYISAILGNEFPGEGTIYLSQTVIFLKPVFVGSKIKVSIYIKGFEKEKIAVMQTNIMDLDGKVLVEGEAKVMLPS